MIGHAPRCGVCHDSELRGPRASWTTCQACEGWTRARIAEIARLWMELPDHLERGRGHSANTPVSGNTPTAGSLPTAEAVLNLIGPGGVPDRLTPYDQAIRDARRLPAYPHRGTGDYRVREIVQSLDRHLPWAVQHHDLEPLALELQRLLGEMRHATGQERPPATTRELSQSCPALVDDVECGGTLRYEIQGGAVRCDACPNRLDPDQWLAFAAAAA